MKVNIRKWPITTLSGLLVILIYCIFTAVSWILYPAPYGPVTHYLSRLGNFDYSPTGAYFYNLGCILTGLVLVPFFVSLRVWYAEPKFQRFLLFIGQLFGVLSSFALILIGVFSEDQGTPHMTASSTFFVLNFIVLILISLALLWHTKFFKSIALYGIAICLLSLGLEISIGGPITEWFTVFGSLVFVGLISMNSLRLGDDSGSES
ncbi:MAG: DUF998 domain-containing protein [Candidatus Thorarchaeota archaeon]